MGDTFYPGRQAFDAFAVRENQGYLEQTRLVFDHGRPEGVIMASKTHLDFGIVWDCWLAVFRWRDSDLPYTVLVLGHGMGHSVPTI